VSALLAGIDGGQTSTVALVADERGCVLGRGTAGPADEVGEGVRSTRLADALRAALRDACRTAGLDGDREFAAIVAGVSGYDGRVRGTQPHLPTHRFVLTHDAPVAHAGAFGGGAGVVVIAGTGSVVYGIDEKGAAETLGGWGYLFGDEGSAFGLVRDALAAMMWAQDAGDDTLSDEARAACEFFGVASLRALVRAFAGGELTRERLASFAPVALRFARLREIGGRGADRLAALAVRALERSGVHRVALTGGLFENEAYAARVRDAIVAAAGDAQFTNPKYEPAAGALLLAFREAGLPMPELRR
jgi:N-acetylglucosamine kinase-like BadF-type ATPase